MYTRTFYIEKIKPFIDKPIIKVITGMRRVGKSFFLRQIQEHVNRKVDSVVYIDKESLEFDFIRNYTDLNDYVKGKLPRGGYLFVDEIQNIEQWEKAIASLHGEGFDIYITGSNAHFLSSDLATLLSGRYVRFDMYPLSFVEYLEFSKTEDAAKGFDVYFKRGGLPAVHNLQGSDEVINQYMASLYDTILLKDIIARFEVRNVGLFTKISHYLFDNVGNIFSAKSITDYLKAQRIKVGLDTIHNYLEYLCGAFVFYKVPRYDIKGKRLLELYEKYYMGDIGLRNALALQPKNQSGVLENIVFLELQKRGYTVSIGRMGTLEVDFIAERREEIAYFQIAWKVSSEDCLMRELAPLQKIKDQHPKYLLSLDSPLCSNFDGIRHLNLIEFLKQPS
ncbi:MAG: hypothetical protein A2Y14_01540 [Verrucomicrobia bacterium GWF2_51_19]|nr:MAG: hypothetical protein A2Y14_01540 [Verrucomicrobia bacterium GWF2_51_19]HCJ11650.1 ATPase [Opitutae bacterium]